MYAVRRNPEYDFVEQSYNSLYPNLHKYPATMLPQIGVKLLRDYNINSGKLLDPYCGSGSSFASGLECGIAEMEGFDLNPLAVLISKAKFTKLNVQTLVNEKDKLRKSVYEFMKDEENFKSLRVPNITNINFWFSIEVIKHLATLQHFISMIENQDIKQFFLMVFSETVRDCSYTRNSEFKLFRIKEEDILSFNPDTIGLFFKKLNNVISVYEQFYLPKLENAKIDVKQECFNTKTNYYDVVLTSPPYGDSKTTVAYGQFSTLSNEWLGFEQARKVDRNLMGGIKSKKCFSEGLISDYIREISEKDSKRALEVSSFYFDLQDSIFKVAESVKQGGYIFYVVGNRKVKDVQLPTDQFIAEQFCKNGFEHIETIQRLLSGKTMPLKNSPSNKRGKTSNTMNLENIVVCRKI